MLRPLLQRKTAHGLLLAVHLPKPTEAIAPLLDALHESERRRTDRYANKRKLTYAGGRIALRRVLETLGRPCSDPIPSSKRGAPILPPGLRGSISHKDELACALAEVGENGQIGVDVELVGAPSDRIIRLVLTEKEQADHVALPEAERSLVLALRWSLKEALYKALDPYLQRYVGFQEAEVWPTEDGGARISLTLKNNEGPFVVDGRWFQAESYVFATVRCIKE